MTTWLAIALGGAFGAVARFWVAGGIYGFLGRDFPHGTLFVNVSGSFLMGFLIELMLQRFPLTAEYRAAVLVGFLGAYTTFSTFAVETLYLLEEGSFWKAGLNMLLSVLLCLAAVWVGLVLGRRLFAPDIYPWLGHGRLYGRLALILAGAVLAGLVSEWSFRLGGFGAALRAGALIAILGLTTLLSTLAVLPHLADTDGGSGLLGLFAASAVAGTLAVALGMSLGRLL
jgi:CrcB protein